MTLLICLALQAQVAAAPLPALAIDSYPPAARAAIARVHARAVENPHSVEAVGGLARTLHAWELWDAARQAYERAERLAPRAFEWPYLHGVVLQRLARHAEAASRFREAVSREPTSLPARVRLAESLLDAGSIEESEPLFRALAGEPAARPAAELALGRIAAAGGRHDDAIVHLERAVSLFPEFGAAHYALARSYRALGRGDEARRALALHERHGAGWPAIPDNLLAGVTALKDDPRAALQRGVTLAEAGDVAGAIAAHEEALAADPSLADAHSNLISLYGRAGDRARAEAHYRAAVAAGVNLGDAHYDYGVLLGLQEEWGPAADAYRRALAVNPLHAHAWNNLGQILERTGTREEAEAAYRQAVSSRPAFRLARFNLGRMLIALGRPADAVAELRTLVEPRDAEAPRYLFALSVAYVRAGEKAEGIRWGAEARRLALEHGQHDLAAAIARDLASIQ